MSKAWYGAWLSLIMRQIVREGYGHAASPALNILELILWQHPCIPAGIEHQNTRDLLLYCPPT